MTARWILVCLEHYKDRTELVEWPYDDLDEVWRDITTCVDEGDAEPVMVYEIGKWGTVGAIYDREHMSKQTGRLVP